MLTVFRMVLIPVFVTLLFYQRFLWALGVFVTAGLTDGLDGLLARRFGWQSQLGTVLDPIADKLMLVTAFIVLSMRSVFPQPLTGSARIRLRVLVGGNPNRRPCQAAGPVPRRRRRQRRA